AEFKDFIQVEGLVESDGDIVQDVEFTVATPNFILGPLHFSHVHQNTLVALNATRRITRGEAALDHRDFLAVLAPQLILKITNIALPRHFIQELGAIALVHINRLNDINAEHFLLAGEAQHADERFIAVKDLAVRRRGKNALMHVIEERRIAFVSSPCLSDVFDHMDRAAAVACTNGIAGTGNNGISAEAGVLLTGAIHMHAVGAAFPANPRSGQHLFTETIHNFSLWAVQPCNERLVSAKDSISGVVDKDEVGN